MVVFIAQGEMEVEDINFSDDPTEDVQTKTPEETPKSGLRLVRLVIVSFGLLCVLQATLNISLRLVNFNADQERDLIHERDQLKTSNQNLTTERDQFKTSNQNLTTERDQFKTSNQNLTTERDYLLQWKHCVSNDGGKWFGSSCYYVSTEKKTWNESRQDCKERDADLVVINSREEQVFLFSFKTTAWIGLTDRDEERTWTWVDGTPLTTAYWASGQPDNHGGVGPSEEGQDCVVISINSRAPENRWFDVVCDAQNNWICERETSI